jgi:hypothetical protein
MAAPGLDPGVDPAIHDLPVHKAQPTYATLTAWMAASTPGSSPGAAMTAKEVASGAAPLNRSEIAV